MTRRLLTIAIVTVLSVATAAPVMAQEEKATGLERAREASMKALDHANARAIEARGGKLPPGLAKADKANKGNKADKLTGRERAAASIAAALERGNGNGNGFGRGHSAEVLGLLLAGESPAALESGENHGARVSAMVKAYNELKKAEKQQDSDPEN